MFCYCHAIVCVLQCFNNLQLFSKFYTLQDFILIVTLCSKILTLQDLVLFGGLYISNHPCIIQQLQNVWWVFLYLYVLKHVVKLVFKKFCAFITIFWKQKTGRHKLRSAKSISTSMVMNGISYIYCKLAKLKCYFFKIYFRVATSWEVLEFNFSISVVTLYFIQARFTHWVEYSVALVSFIIAQCARTKRPKHASNQLLQSTLH